MQINNSFFRGARKLNVIVTGVVFGLVGLAVLGFGVYLLIVDLGIEGSDKGFDFILMGVGAVLILASVISFIRASKQSQKPLTEEQVAKKAAEAPATPKFDNVKDTKLFFHWYGKMNQSYLVENREGQHVYEINMVKFNPFGADTFQVVDIENQYKREMKATKVLTNEDNGWTSSSKFKIDNVNCWDYLNNKGYELRHELGGKTLTYFELYQFNKLVAKIVPCEYKDPWNEESSRILRMGIGVFRLEIIDANLDDVVMAAFIAARVNLIH